MFQFNGYPNIFRFSNQIILDQSRKKVEQHICYKIKIFKNKGYFGIIKNTSNYVTLSQLMDTVGNINHEVILAENLISDSNYQKSLTLAR